MRVRVIKTGQMLGEMFDGVIKQVAHLVLLKDRCIIGNIMDRETTDISKIPLDASYNSKSEMTFAA